MKSKIQHFIKSWFWVLALLAVTLSFPSTREAQTLCLRWLLHLNGKTFVQGQPGGCVVYEIPNVQFTQNYLEVLRNRSTNSLDDYALAIVIGDFKELCRPVVEAAWKDNPLLPWIVLETSWQSVEAANTNVMPEATFNWQQHLIHLAQEADPTNGAFWQAEAAIDFAVHDNAAAIRALETAANLTNWDAGSAGGFARLSHLLELSGLSELDAADRAYVGAVFTADEIQGQNRIFIDNQMVQAVNRGEPEQFVKLLRLLVELRRMDWSDHSADTHNAYRNISPSHELIDAMAVPLKINLATNWTSDFPMSKSIRRQVFQKYLSQYADPVTVATFNSQAKSYELERRLRFQIAERDDDSVGWWSGWCRATGTSSLFFLSLVVASLLFEVIIWHLKHRADSLRRWPRELKFWVLSLVVITCSSLVLIQFARAIGAGEPDGFGEEESPSIVGPIFAGFFLAFFVFSGWLLGLVMDWVSAKQSIKPWKVTRFLICVYLVCIIAVACCRDQCVAAIASAFQ